MPRPDPPRPDPRDAYLKKLRGWRTRPAPERSLAEFLPAQFKQEVERPYKQMASVVRPWMELVPAELRSHTRLEALSRGVLRVVVDSSARLYELDRLLRGGLEQRLISAHKGPAFRKVQLRVGPLDGPAPVKALPTE